MANIWELGFQFFIYLNKTISIKGKGFLLQALQMQPHQNSVAVVTVFSNLVWGGFFGFVGFGFVLPWVMDFKNFLRNQITLIKGCIDFTWL